METEEAAPAGTRAVLGGDGELVTPEWSCRAQEVLNSVSSSGAELFVAASGLHRFHSADGTHDRVVMGGLERARRSGLTYDCAPKEFLQASKLLAHLCFKYNRLRDASNYLLFLRELSGPAELPGWVANYSAKLLFKLDLPAAVGQPETFFALVPVSEGDQTPASDPQRLAVIKEYLHAIADYLRAHPGSAPALTPGYVGRVRNCASGYEHLLTEELLDVSRAISGSDLVETRPAEDQERQDAASDALVQENRALQVLLERRSDEIDRLQQQVADLSSRIEGLTRQNSLLEQRVGGPRPEPTEGVVRTSAESAATPTASLGVATEGETKVLVLGASHLPERYMHGIAKSLGLEKEQLDLRTDYAKNKRLDLDRLRYSSPYSGILVGPIAHKVVGLGDHTSVVQKLREEEGFPPAVEIRTASGQLKISKTAFRGALRTLLTVIRANVPS